MKKLLPLFLMFNLAFAYFTIDGENILDNNGNPILLKGLGLGGWLVPEGYMLKFPGFGSPSSINEQIVDVLGESKAREFYKIYHQNYVTKEDIIKIKNWGFNHIRLPFSYKMFDSETPSPIFVDDGFAVVDSCLCWCKEAGLYLILDMHCAPGGQNPGNISDSDGEAKLWTDPDNQDKIVDIWQTIANRYAQEEWIIGYDLINEPVLPDGYDGQNLRSLYLKIKNAIREVDQEHIIFIEGDWYATDFSGLTPIFDPKMVYSFHKYWNPNNTGAIQSYLNIRNNTGVPLWLGETGENSNTWFAEMVELVENKNIGWCCWTHKKFETTTAPFSAQLPSDFSQLTNYWEGNTNKPIESKAWQILQEFANNLKTEKCKINPGVIPAYLDNKFLTTNKKVKENTIPGKIYAVDYDIGNQGIAYSDNDYKRNQYEDYTPWNQGWEYRNDGVDIESCDDPKSNGYNVGWTVDGEWLKYTVNIEHSGNYNLEFRIAGNGGKIKLLYNGKDVRGNIEIPATGGWQNWKSINIEDIELKQGQGTLKLQIIESGFNFNSLDFSFTEGVNNDISPLQNYCFLSKNYPNPFNPSTKIEYNIPNSSHVSLSIYDLLGNKVKTLVNKNLSSGHYEVCWHGTNQNEQNVSSGIYIYELITENDCKINKMLLKK
ncbi:MAG: cellulase family glycosylhydrolase [Candidatus Marinimicrobia bacterium]|nr:cellulase family glycosylhydrolase [Candidatus Neomarinimicrobiota bacterium]